MAWGHIERWRRTALAALAMLAAAAPAQAQAQAQRTLAHPQAAAPATKAEAVPQIGHASVVRSVAFSPDGQLALSGSEDKTLKLWNVATGKELRTFFVRGGGVKSVAFSPDGRFAAAGGWDNLELWDLSTGEKLRSFLSKSWITTVAYSPDGRFVVSGSWEASVRLWDVATGRELRSFTGHSEQVWAVAFSPDGRFILSGGRDRKLRMWDVATGAEARSFEGHTSDITSVAFSPDGRFVLSGGHEGKMILWDAATGQQLRSFEGTGSSFGTVAFSPDSRLILSDGVLKLLLWDVATGKQLRSFEGHSSGVNSVVFSPDGRFTLSGSNDYTMKLWDAATGKELRSFERHTASVRSVAFSPDGRLALFNGYDRTLQLWDMISGRVLRSFSGKAGWEPALALSPDGSLALTSGENDEVLLWDVAAGSVRRSFGGHAGWVKSVAFSPDGLLALSSGNDKTVKLWDVKTGKLLRTLTGHTYEVLSVAFSPDGRFALSGGSYMEPTVKLWNVANGREVHTLQGHYGSIVALAFSPDGRLALSASDEEIKLWDVASGKELRSFNHHLAYLKTAAFSPDGQTIVSGGGDNLLRLWDAVTGNLLRTLSGHSGKVCSAVFSPAGRFFLSGSDDGTARIWDARGGSELAMMMATPGGEWLTMTPGGFFSGSHRDTGMLAIVRGLNVTTIGQVHQSLFNPDLVREAIAADPGAEVKRAAEVMNLEKVLDSGPPPAVAIASNAPGGKLDTGLVTLAARVTDRGKGIGRIEWRINGVTAGVMAAPAGRGPDYEVKQELALDPGENRIEVIAYEKRNLLASLPARSTIVYDGPEGTARQKLHILAIGINAYNDQGWTPPGSSGKLAFPPLNLAVADAKAFGAEMQKAGTELYSEVRITEALDADATFPKLGKLIKQMAAGIGPRDTFVLYAAAHGYSRNGSYYMIPQDYQGGPDPEALKTRAIGQDRLQDWIANRIKAKKALILLDTCESGALTSGYTKSRTDAPASEAAVGRLLEATGRPVLTAAAAGKPAFEGYKGHGVFTYALMEALHKGDTNNNGRIELTELAAHVQKRVPELVAELGEHGGVVKGAAVVAMRGAEGDKQSAHFGSTGEDFAVVARLP